MRSSMVPTEDVIGDAAPSPARHLEKLRPDFRRDPDRFHAGGTRKQKKRRSSLTPGPVPLISTLPRRTPARTQREAMASQRGSVSENWIASRFDDCGFRYVSKETIPRCTWRFPPDASLNGNVERVQIFYGEFDPGSERTLAAGLTHASRARKWLRPSVKRRTGE